MTGSSWVARISPSHSFPTNVSVEELWWVRPSVGGECYGLAALAILGEELSCGKGRRLMSTDGIV